MFGQVASITKTDSAAMKVPNAIALSKSRFVLRRKYAIVAKSVMKTARVIPPICKKMWTICNPWSKWGAITGKAKMAITPVTTIENNVDFLSSMVSGRNKVYRITVF